MSYQIGTVPGPVDSTNVPTPLVNVVTYIDAATGVLTSKYPDGSTRPLVEKTGIAQQAFALGSNALTSAITGVAAYANNDAYIVGVTQTNTGAVTFNINNLGAKAIQKNINTPLVAGDLVAGDVVRLVYDGTAFKLNGKVVGNKIIQTFRIPTASILAINTTAVELIRRPAATEYIQILEWSAKYDYNSAAYATVDAGGLQLKYKDGTGVGNAGAIPASVLTGTVTARTSATGSQVEPLLNERIVAWMAAADPVTGDSDIIASIAYQILSDPS